MAHAFFSGWLQPAVKLAKIQGPHKTFADTIATLKELAKLQMSDQKKLPTTKTHIYVKLLRRSCDDWTPHKGCSEDGCSYHEPARRFPLTAYNAARIASCADDHGCGCLDHKTTSLRHRAIDILDVDRFGTSRGYWIEGAVKATETESDVDLVLVLYLDRDYSEASGGKCKPFSF